MHIGGSPFRVRRGTVVDQRERRAAPAPAPDVLVGEGDAAEYAAAVERERPDAGTSGRRAVDVERSVDADGRPVERERKARAVEARQIFVLERDAAQHD